MTHKIVKRKFLFRKIKIYCLPPQLVQDALVNEIIEIIFYSLTQEGNKENHLDLCLPHSNFPILLSCCCLVPRQALCSQRLPWPALCSNLILGVNTHPAPSAEESSPSCQSLSACMGSGDGSQLLHSSGAEGRPGCQPHSYLCSVALQLPRLRGRLPNEELQKDQAGRGRPSLRTPGLRKGLAYLPAVPTCLLHWSLAEGTEAIP